MFFIEVEGVVHRFENQLKDNFLDAVAKHFGYEPEEMIVHYMADADRARALMNRKPRAEHIYSLATPGVVELKRRMEPDLDAQPGVKPGWETLAVFPLKRVVKWSEIDAKGHRKFIGNQLEA